jgi:hypothetical protein
VNLITGYAIAPRSVKSRGMSWEAFRLTSKSPAELLEVMSPSGVDSLIRDMLMACWRYLQGEQRTIPNWRKHADEVFNRNMRVWRAIKKPSPGAFFENLLPHPEDGFMRQALVLAWMMLPRAGGRKFTDVAKIVGNIYQRNLDTWEADNRTFTSAKAKKPSTRPKPVKAKSKRAVKTAKRK